MYILVTGGAGFIGSSIAHKLIELNFKVLILDNLHTGRKKNIPKRAKFIKCNLQSYTAIKQIFQKYKINHIFHQAALANVRESIIKPKKYIDINLIGSLNLLELSKQYNVKSFTFASSGGCVYGQSKRIPTSENAIISPLDPYGATKSNFETYLDIYHRLHGINYTSLRYANVYGPRQNPFGEAGVISIFSKLLLNNSQVTINGDGENIRDFVYIDDVVDANILAMKKSANCSLNVGTGKGITINNLYKNLRKIIGSDLRPFYGPEKEGEVKKSTLNIKKIKNLYGWKPKTKFNKGLIKTIEHIKKFE